MIHQASSVPPSRLPVSVGQGTNHAAKPLPVSVGQGTNHAAKPLPVSVSQGTNHAAKSISTNPISPPYQPSEVQLTAIS